MKIANLYNIYLNHRTISTDSRNIPLNSIFFALKGENFNGNPFAKSAVDKGAAFVVIDQEAYMHPGDERFILVHDVLKTLQELANFHRKQLKIPVVAITGSNGKTTTKELTTKVLSKKYKTLATKGNLNNHIGVPLTVLSIDNSIEVAIIEMGANHQGEIKMLCEIAEPTHGLITNVGMAHLEGFGGFEGVKKGKGELYQFLGLHEGVAFVNYDNVHLKNMIAGHLHIKDIIGYGSGEYTDCKGSLSEMQPFLKANLSYKKDRFQKEYIASTKLIGKYNLENIIAAACIGDYFDVGHDLISEAIADYSPDNSRSQVIQKGSNTIYMDAYNANPTSMTAAIINFSEAAGNHKIVMLGDMHELGTESEEAHREIIALLKKQSFDKIILVGNYFSAPANEIDCLHFKTSAEAASTIKLQKINNSLILIKGSRGQKMELLLDAI